MGNVQKCEKMQTLKESEGLKVSDKFQSFTPIQ